MIAERYGIALVALAALVVVVPNRQERTPNAAALLRCAQQAVGVSDAASLKSFELEGRVTRSDLSGKPISKALNIRALLPDSFLRVEREAFREGTVSYLYGFSGTHLLTRVTTDSPTLQFGGSWGAERLPTERRDAALFLLELLALPLPNAKIEPDVALSPDGQHRLLSIQIEDRTAVLHLDARCVPSLLTYSAPIRLPTPGQSVTVLPGPVIAEVRVVIRDRVRMNALLVPRSITKQASGVDVERLEIGRFRKNIRLTERDFLAKEPKEGIK